VSHESPGDIAVELRPPAEEVADVGDLLLQTVGPKLGEPLRRTDTLARLGGDEFAVLLPPATDLETASQVAERLVGVFDQPFIVEGMSLDVGVSIGLAAFPDHAGDASGLLQSADMAMYKAKRERLGYALFDAETRAGDIRRLGLQRDLRRAIDGGELEVLFQPKVDAGSWQLVAVEALVRWNHPALGLLSPEAFLPIAEQTGLILPLTLSVLNQCLLAQRRWRDDGNDLAVAINLSPKWLRDEEFPRILKLLLGNWQGRPDRLILEVPEAAVMSDPDTATRLLHRIAGQGVRIALDDFGTGYSSLRLLQRLPIHELKIDQSFVAGMVEDDSAVIVVRSMIRLAHGLGMAVTAEGVETETTAHWLRSLGCNALQGYLFAAPLAAADVPGWLERHAGSLASRAAGTAATPAAAGPVLGSGT